MAQYRALLVRYGSVDNVIGQWSRDSAVPVAMLKKVAARLRVRLKGQGEPDLLAALDDLIRSSRETRQVLAETRGGDSPQIARLRGRVKVAYEAGDWEHADQLSGQLIELREKSIASRKTNFEAADEQARAELVRDLMDQARIAGDLADFERSIAILRRARATAPQSRPTVGALVDGYLISVLLDRGRLLRDSAMIREAVEIQQRLRAVEPAQLDHPSWFFLQSLYAESLLTLGEMTEDPNVRNASLLESRALYAGCKVLHDRPEPPKDPKALFDGRECHASTGAPGLPAARDLLFRTTFAYGMRLRDMALVDEASGLLEEKIAGLGGDERALERAEAEMQLGVLLNVSAEQRENADAGDKAVALLERARDEPGVSAAPYVRAPILLNLGGAYLTQQRYGDALNAFDEALPLLPPDAPREVLLVEMNRGIAIMSLARRNGDIEQFKTAAQAFSSAAKRTSKEGEPALWAQLKLNTGALLVDQYELDGDPATLKAASEAYDAARSVITCQTNKAAWAIHLYGMAGLSIAAGDKANNWMGPLMGATLARQAMVNTNQNSNPGIWARYAERYGEGMLKAAVLERAGAYSFVQEGLDAFDGAVRQYEKSGAYGRAGSARYSEAAILANVAAQYKSKPRKKALYEQALWAAKAARDEFLHYGDNPYAAQSAALVVTISERIQSARLGWVRAAPFPAVRSDRLEAGCPPEDPHSGVPQTPQGPGAPSSSASSPPL